MAAGTPMRYTDILRFRGPRISKVHRSTTEVNRALRYTHNVCAYSMGAEGDASLRQGFLRKGIP